jgi:hypothetical protein
LVPDRAYDPDGATATSKSAANTSMMSDHGSLGQVTGVDVHLPATNLSGREDHLVSQPPSRVTVALGTGKSVIEAGGDQRDPYDTAKDRAGR